MTFSLEFCKKLHAVLGDWPGLAFTYEWEGKRKPCVDFQTLLRLLPHVGAKKGWCELHGGDWYWFDQKDVVMHVAMLYALAPTEEEAYAQAENYLNEII